jgi:hypothetical protein
VPYSACRFHSEYACHQAKEIARHAKDAVLILTGRSLLDNRKKAQLQELSDLGAQLSFIVPALCMIPFNPPYCRQMSAVSD